MKVKGILLAFILLLSAYLATESVPVEVVPNGFTEVRVERVVDGDTVVLSFNGTTTKARLIGVDTPESVNPKKSVECYSVEAKEYTKNLLSTSVAYIETDDSQGVYDKYGRILVYIYTGTTTPSVNELLIRNGYAREYTYDKPYRYAGLFKESEKHAQEKQLGVWNSATCIH